jgi:MoaA/NifB/PqqE/SkfB family radical SAM enzyme
MKRLSLFDRIAYAPFNVQLVLTRKCNLSCGYCNEHDHESLPVPVKVIKAYINQLAELGTWSLTFTGGEPLLHPKVVAITRYAKERILYVGMISNVYLINDEMIARLNEAGLSYMQISIDGVHRNSNTMKVLNLMKTNLDLLAQKATFEIHLNSVLGVNDPDEVLEVIAYAKSRGFRTTIGLLHDGTGLLKLNKHQLNVWKEAQSLLAKPWWDRGTYERQLIEKGQAPFKCRAGGRYLYVDEWGIVHYCSQRFSMYQKPLMQYSLQDLKANFKQPKACHSTCTIGCVRRASWWDGWRP